MIQRSTILLVDGCHADRDTYCQYLLADNKLANDKLQLQILVAASGQQGLELCQQLLPDLVLVEFRLPDLDGLEFIRRLQSLTDRSLTGKTLPVVMLTRYGSESVAVRAFKSGAADYLIKTETTPESLQDVVRCILAQTRSLLELDEDRFRTSVENMLDCFGIYAAMRNESGKIVDFRIDYVNAAACEINQMTKAQQLGKQLCEIFPAHQDSELFEQYCQVVETGNPLLKTHYIYADTSSSQYPTRVFDIRATKLGDGFVASWRDITQSKRQEEQLSEKQQFIQQIADTTPGLLYLYDLIEQRNVYVNRQVTEILGYTPQQIQAMGTALLRQLMHPEDLARLPALLERFHFAQAGEVIETEYRMRHANGEWRWLWGREVVFRKTVDNLPHQILGTAQDITARKQLEEELSQANERFELAARAVNCLIYDWDIQQNIVTRSEGLTRILGYSLAEAEPTRQWWLNLIHPDDLREGQAEIAATLAHKDFYTAEYRVRNKNNEYDYVLDRGIIIRDSSGQPIRAVGSTVNISDRKRAETALQQSEAKFRRLFESNIIGIIWADEQKIINANDIFLEMVGYSRQELQVGKLHWQKMTPAEYSDLDRQGIAESISSGVCTPFEKEYIRQDGTRVPILIGAAILERSPLTWICFILDLSDRRRMEVALRESEEWFRCLADAIPQLVWTCAADGLADYVNQRWHDYTGLTLEQTLGYGWRTVLHPDDVQRSAQLWQVALQNGTPYEIEHRYRRAADGTYHWHLVRGIPLKDSSGQIVKWFGTCTDIDEQKQLEAERTQLLALARQAQAEAEAANRTKDEFVAMVSHDLRAPLNAILGWSQLLRQRHQDKAILDRALETIERNAKAQSNLIEDLLDVSRMIQGQLQLELSPVELVPLIEAAIHTAYPSANAKEIDLEFVVAEVKSQEPGVIFLSQPPQPSLPTPYFPIISGDPQRLQQILANLLSNAIKFTPEGGRVEVWLELVEQSNRNDEKLENKKDDRLPITNYQSSITNFVQIEVTDTGIGIDPELLPYIFDRFRQGRSSDGKKGLGLGLAIARYLVELHGGTIHASSPGIGQGATFTLLLPLLSGSRE